jgi:hypothetical protein
MRMFGKAAWGIGAATAIYLCIDMVLMSSNGAPKKALPVAEAADAPRVETPMPLVERISAPVEQQPNTATAPRIVEPGRPERAPQTDRLAELAARLEAEYAVDAHPTRESSEKEKAVQALFSQPELEGKGRLQELDCRQTICRGVVQIANAGSDNAVFGNTIASPSFARASRDAVTVASRQKMSDGSVLATFFIHPQSVFAMGVVP